MKNLRFVVLIICVLLLATSGTFAKDNMAIKYTLLGALDMFGEAEQDSDYEIFDGSTDVNIGITIGAEGIVALDKNFYAGLGLRYLLPRDTDPDGDDAEIGISAIIPYGILQMNIPTDGDIQPYIVAHLGYNYPIIDTEEAEEDLEEEYGDINPSFDASGGFYYGLGVGLYFTENVGMQILYNVSYNTTEYEDDTGDEDDMDNEYSRLTIAVTYTFN